MSTRAGHDADAPHSKANFSIRVDLLAWAKEQAARETDGNLSRYLAGLVEAARNKMPAALEEQHAATGRPLVAMARVVSAVYADAVAEAYKAHPLNESRDAHAVASSLAGLRAAIGRQMVSDAASQRSAVERSMRATPVCVPYGLLLDLADGKPRSLDAVLPGGLTPGE